MTVLLKPLEMVLIANCSPTPSLWTIYQAQPRYLVLILLSTVLEHRILTRKSYQASAARRRASETRAHSLIRVIPLKAIDCFSLCTPHLRRDYEHACSVSEQSRTGTRHVVESECWEFVQRVNYHCLCICWPIERGIGLVYDEWKP